MADARKPSEDAKEGLELLFRAAGKLAREVERELKQDVDVGKLAEQAGKLAGKASQEVLRAAGAVGREIDRAAASASRALADEPRHEPPQARAPSGAEAPADDTSEATRAPAPRGPGGDDPPPGA